MRHVLIALLAAVSVAMYAAGAQAAAPQNGAVLTGTIQASPFPMTVTTAGRGPAPSFASAG